MAALYQPRNFLGIAAAYGLTLLSAGVSFMLAQPWMMGLGLGITGLVQYSIQRLTNRSTRAFTDSRAPGNENTLSLDKEQLKALYQRSGLDPQEYPVYDVDPATTITWQSNRRFSMKGKASGASILANQKIIAVSQPLMQSLDKSEQHAMLAHAFAKVSGRQQAVTVPQRILASTASITNVANVFSNLFKAGYDVMIGFLGAQASIRMLFNDKAAATKTPAEKKRTADKKDALMIATTAIVTGLIDPVFTKLYLITEGLHQINKFSARMLNRLTVRAADRNAVTLGANPLSLITALRKVDMAETGGRVPARGFLGKIWDRVSAAQPSLESRIAGLAKLAEKQGYSAEEIKTAATAWMVVPPKPLQR